MSDSKKPIPNIDENIQKIRELNKKYESIINNPAMEAVKKLNKKSTSIGSALGKSTLLRSILGKSTSIGSALLGRSKHPNIIGKALIKDNLPPTTKQINREMLNLSFDKRSRAERAEDFETELLKIDRERIKLLINTLEKINKNPEIKKSDIKEIQDSVIKTLVKYERTISTFEALNSDLAIQLDYKKNELKFIAKSDWRDKFRLLFFRILGTIFFISALFVIGHIEHKYDWAHLPMSKYFNVDKK